IFFIPTVASPFLFEVIGEEIGWRGYLVRRLAERPVAASLLSGTVWLLYAVPLFFDPKLAGHKAETILTLPWFLVEAVILTALYRWSRSIWPGAVLHLSTPIWSALLYGDPYYHPIGLFTGRIGSIPSALPFSLAIELAA